MKIKLFLVKVLLPLLLLTTFIVVKAQQNGDIANVVLTLVVTSPIIVFAVASWRTGSHDIRPPVQRRSEFSHPQYPEIVDADYRIVANEIEGAKCELQIRR